MHMYNTKIGEFCATHDNWEELLAAEPYNIKIKKEAGFVIFNYNQLSSDFNNEIVRDTESLPDNSWVSCRDNWGVDFHG